MGVCTISRQVSEPPETPRIAGDRGYPDLRDELNNLWSRTLVPQYQYSISSSAGQK